MSVKSKSAKRKLSFERNSNSEIEAAAVYKRPQTKESAEHSITQKPEAPQTEEDEEKQDGECSENNTWETTDRCSEADSTTDSCSKAESSIEESSLRIITEKVKDIQIDEDEIDEDEIDEDEEQQDGEWLKNHIWKTKEPDSTLKMKATVSNSASYPTPSKWTKNNKADGSVDLAEIYSNLPSYIEDVMKGGINSCRQELERVLQTPLSELALDTPHVLEIKNESVPSKDQEVLKREDEKFTASSLTSPPKNPEDKNFYYFDCEHILKMYVPSSKLSWFQTQEKSHTRWIGKIKCNNYMGKRWVFIPSFRRAKIALLQWPDDEIMNDNSTIRILVVRPSEFDTYVRYCGPHFPVIRLPQDEIGVGYARYWIQKIALRLELQFIWMVDDSIISFCEYDPSKEPPERSYIKFRNRKFGLVFERIEKFVKKGEEVPIVAMSPKRFCTRKTLKQPFVCKPPQGAVYLNLRKLQEKHVYYRPELKTLEDMVFGYECEQRNLKVLVDNRILLRDKRWEDTGASSLSVKTQTTQSSSSGNKKPTESSPSVKEQTTQRSSSGNKKPTESSPSVKEQTTQRSSSGNKKPTESSSSGNKKPTQSSSSGNKKPTQRTPSAEKKTTQSSSSGNKKTPQSSSSGNKKTPQSSSTVKNSRPRT